MAPLRVGIIGTGKKPDPPGPAGYGMAHQHAAAYRALGDDRCRLVACADIVEENARAFAETFDVKGVYLDYREMLAAEEPDVVSICTWPHLHAPMVYDCAASGVRAVHCEKPMADTWGAARRMAGACKEHGVQLTFNHQRRFGRPFRQARDLLAAGEIGALRRVEFAAANLYDYGSHSFELSGFFNENRPARWVLCQLDYREEKLFFGAHNENQAVVQWQYANGVYGLGVTGPGDAMIGCHNRLVGTAGVIELGRRGAPTPLRIRRDGAAGWEDVETGGEGVHGPGYIQRAIADVVNALETGGTSELDAAIALNSTEIMFACFESVRRRGRVDLPLEIDDNPLTAMVAAGDLRPAPPA